MESCHFLTHEGSTGMHSYSEIHSTAPPHDAVWKNFFCSLQWLIWEAEEKLTELPIPNSVCSLTQTYQLPNSKQYSSIVPKSCVSFNDSANIKCWFLSIDYSSRLNILLIWHYNTCFRKHIAKTSSIFCNILQRCFHLWVIADLQAQTWMKVMQLLLNKLLDQFTHLSTSWRHVGIFCAFEWKEA